MHTAYLTKQERRGRGELLASPDVKSKGSKMRQDQREEDAAKRERERVANLNRLKRIIKNKTHLGMKTQIRAMD